MACDASTTPATHSINSAARGQALSLNLSRPPSLSEPEKTPLDNPNELNTLNHYQEPSQVRGLCLGRGGPFSWKSCHHHSDVQLQSWSRTLCAYHNHTSQTFNTAKLHSSIIFDFLPETQILGIFAMLHGKTLNSTLLLLFIVFATAHGRSYPCFSRNDTEFQHLVLHPHPSVGTVYVGARDHLFQLDGSNGLRLELEETTGPMSDSKDCLPPVTEFNCPQARRTSNHNKLLLVDPKALELITCGSIHQGTCQKRSLASIKKVIFSTERPVDTQYVAANDPSVSTVGLVVGLRGGEKRVMYVGRGYTASHPPISTRHLSSEPLFSYEETAKLAVAGRMSEYDHHFVMAFTRRTYVYILFYRRDIKSLSREYRTYAARVCLDDTSYYSYVEVPLVCQSPSSPLRTYNLLQAAQVGQGAGREGEDLLGVFSTRISSTNNNPLDASALCVYPLDELDRRIDSTRDLCYTQAGRVEGSGEVAYIEYEVKSSCANLPMNTLKAYPCGSDHTPSPMASRAPLEAKAVWHTSTARLTAVAVSVREGHSIAFLGDSKGTLHKVYLGQDGQVEVYANMTIQPNSPINSDLLLDQNGAHIYIMTKTTVEKRPVAECGDHLDCQSCLSVKDPYCGWCVLEGRCGQHWECQRRSVQGQWLWSFNQQQCLSIQHLSLYNISLGEKTDIAVSVAGLPSLEKGEAYSCFFQDAETPASLTNTGVICSTPDASSLPPIGHGDDFMMVTLSLRFINVTVAETEFTFFNCSLVQQLSARRPCQGCVSSRWGCNWCIHQHFCTHKHTCSQGVTIYNQIECPCVEKVQDSSLLPVNVKRKITLVGQHLNLFQDENLDYECVLDIENQSVVMDASVKPDATQKSVFFITCQPHQYAYSALMEEYPAMINVRRKNNNFLIDSANDLYVTLFSCSVGRSDCSRCRTANPKYGCVWCGGATSSRCVYQDSCTDEIRHTCPAPVIHFLDPVSSPVEGGTVVTISGSNLGQRAEDIQNSVTVAGVPCSVIHSRYEVSSRIVCETTSSGGEKSGQASVKVRGGGLGLSTQIFSFQNPILSSIFPQRGPKAGGSSLTIRGLRLTTGHPSDVSVLIGGVPCMVLNIQEDQISCLTRGSNRTGEHSITVRFGGAERHLQGLVYHYTSNPNITMAAPSKSFLSGGRIIRVSGQTLDVVQEPKMRVTLSPPDTLPPRRRRSINRRNEGSLNRRQDHKDPLLPLKRWRRIVPEANCPKGTLCHVKQYESRCTVNSSSLILCPTPAVGPEARRARVKVHFLLDSLRFDFSIMGNEAFSYEPNPQLYPLNQNDPSKPYHHKPGSIISVEGKNLDLAINKHEVEARIGEGVCSVKTLTHNHLYCEPPAQQPSVTASKKYDVMDSLPEFTVKMGNLNFSLGKVQYDSQAQSTFPLEAQVGVGVGASIVALIVLIIVLIYRRKSKQAMRDYKKVQIQLENLETSVRDRCKKEFTDLMTEMMDMSSDLVGSGIPFLDYRAYAERIFFPGHQESPLRRDLDVPESRKQTVEQGLVQLSNLLNSKLFLTKFIHTLEVQRTFSPRDRAYVASLLTVALHGKLEYFTDILKTLLNNLVEQYVAKNPKLMLRRTESVVEKLLTNWMSICLFTFLRESAGESFYMLFRAIKHQVDKGPVDAVTGKAKYTLNDNRLLREDVEYRTLTLNVVIPAVAASGGATTQTVPAKVLDCDTITQVKEKLLEQTWKGTSFSQRPHVDSLNLEWRAGVAGHLILSDEDLTSVVQGSWKRLNTLQHYKVPDGATVALVPRNTKNHLPDSHNYMPGEKTPMLDDGEERGVRLWHLVKASEESELPKHRRGSLRERGGERAKAIPEIYLTRLLSMKGTLQKFVDDLFTAILSTSHPVPLAVKYFFDLLDEQALQHNITDPETIHIWKTNSLPLRFWINILKNPQFIFDVQTSDHVDAVLSVIAQTFMDSCTIADHKLGRDSPINKLLYARDIPRYKQMVERYYADIHQTISASDQEMNSALAELSRNYAAEVNCVVALHELYKYINKYYDQIITSLEEDSTAQKMQLGYRLQQIAAAVENKVTDL
ncbi:plexin-B1-like isoform X4 [Siniperca chuatsi]|uniref:plexin-B1-like isoform X4 n=1 Tax=Siniperca chuatsi TaxID=119488 RepID=UPI001CE179A7|nr:plexin-B1-like isoform X4 [Siniperca chuatsi]